MKTETLLPRDTIAAALEAFVLDRQARRYTPKTIEMYRYTLGSFTDWLRSQGVKAIQEVQPTSIRRYLVWLESRGLKDTTQHAHARAIRTWMRWLVAEGDIEHNPMQYVAMPRLEQRVLPPYTKDDLRRLLSGCKRQSDTGSRNYAIILTLLDTGLRSSELLNMRIGDISHDGLVTVMGKGRKQREVRIGTLARQAIVRWLAYRPEATLDAFLWTGRRNHVDGDQLTPHGLNVILTRLGKRVGVTPCSPHRFRRTFALWCLRDGMDLHTLRLLMGHSGLAVLQRYLALGGEDIARAHILHSPVDRLL